MSTDFCLHEAGACLAAAPHPISATKFIRRMRGGAQSSLVGCDDGHYYVVKMVGNPQGPNLLANEFLGTALATAVGLPVAGSAMVHVSRQFLDDVPESWFQSAKGTTCPKPGLHFGSRLVGNVEDPGRATEYISPSRIGLIENRGTFFGMFLLDVLTNHQDSRQAVFVRDATRNSLRATFVDHGHMFGGPNWNLQTETKRACHLEMALYLDLNTNEALKVWSRLFKLVLPDVLSVVLPRIPESWFEGDLQQLEVKLRKRLNDLDRLISIHLEQVSLPPTEKMPNANMRVQNTGTCSIGTGP